MALTPEFVELISTFLWFGLAVAVLAMFYRPLRDQVIPHLTSLNVMGMELSFARDSMDQAIESANRHDARIELAEKSKQWKVEVPPDHRDRVLQRAKLHVNLLCQARILWVDDHPENNENERRMFRQLGVEVDVAQTTEEALQRAAGGSHELIVSDMEREGDPTAGIDLVERLRQQNLQTPVVFYVGVLDSSKGVPPYAFGITNRPDELLHLVIDVLERSKRQTLHR